jgi:phosphoribosylformimino-5-aminoimidazole carboxamide ribotide isomerase
MSAETFSADDPVAMARRWESEGAKRLHIVDLDGAISGHPVHADLIIKIIQSVQIPVEVGGGIREQAHADHYLSSGASWVIFGTSALGNRPLVAEVASRHPGRIIAGIDARDGHVATRGWTEIHPVGVMELALQMEEIGVSAMILTDIAKDGMLAGPSFDLYREVAQRAKTPLIASGGIASLADLELLAQIRGVEGAIVGKALYAGTISLREACDACEAREVREAAEGSKPGVEC